MTPKIKISKEVEKAAEQAMELYRPRIIFSLEFDEEEIQAFAEANFDQELTDLELHRMKHVLYDNDNVGMTKDLLLLDVIRATIGAEKHWSDEDYKPRN